MHQLNISKAKKKDYNKTCEKYPNLYKAEKEKRQQHGLGKH